jgi:hypothetical protein
MNGMTGSRQKAGFREVFKRFLFIFLPAIIVIGVVMALIYRADLRTASLVLDSDEMHTVKLHKKTIAGDFDSVISDLMFLSKNDELDELLDTGSAAARRGCGGAPVEGGPLLLQRDYKARARRRLRISLRP